jgi:general secretion pathway protein C
LFVRSNFGRDYSEWLFRLASNIWLARLALLMALGFAVWVASTLFWRLALPQGAMPPSDAGLGAKQMVERIAQQQWFGALAVATASAAAPSNFRLRGVIAERRAGQNGMAIISVDGGPDKVYSVGDTLAPGVSLKRVEPAGVLVMRGGREEQLLLPVRGKP